MSKEFFDFDKLFEDFMRAKFSGNKHANPELIRAQMGKLYHQWSETPHKILGGLSPANYFKDITDPQLLVDFLVRSCENDRRPNSFLLDRICEVDETAILIRKLISDNLNSTLTITAIELLQLMNAQHPLEEYVEMLREGHLDSELRELIIETLIENADSVKESLFILLPSADIDLKIIIAEVLIGAEKDERTAKLLTELFLEADNIPLISSYIGRYGDESLVSLLYKALDTCNYMEFLEIKNAIERMGGMVDDIYDFSDDPYYKIIKDGYRT